MLGEPTVTYNDRKSYLRSVASFFKAKGLNSEPASQQQNRNNGEPIKKNIPNVKELVYSFTRSCMI